MEYIKVNNYFGFLRPPPCPPKGWQKHTLYTYVQIPLPPQDTSGIGVSSFSSQFVQASSVLRKDNPQNVEKGTFRITSYKVRSFVK